MSVLLFWKVLVGAHGRVPRFVYWIVVVGSLVGVALGSALAEYDPMWLVVSGLAVYLFLVISACRARDMGSSGRYALLTLVPILGLFIFFQLGIVKESLPSDQTIEPTADLFIPSSTGASWHMPVSFLFLLVGSIPVAFAFMTLLLGSISDTKGAIVMTGIGVVGAVIWTTGVLIARRGD